MLIFFDCVLTPQTLVQSSSLSYMGKTADTIFDFSDTLTLIAAFISTGIGLTILTPLGRIGKSIWFMHWAARQECLISSYSLSVSTQNPKWLYLPTLFTLIIMTAILIGMYHNAFPPMHNGAFYFSYFFISPVLYPLFNTYGKVRVSMFYHVKSGV